MTLRTLLLAAMLLTLVSCGANTGNEAADAIIDTVPMAIFWWVAKVPPF